jgi:hypothetical protein
MLTFILIFGEKLKLVMSFIYTLQYVTQFFMCFFPFIFYPIFTNFLFQNTSICETTYAYDTM